MDALSKLKSELLAELSVQYKNLVNFLNQVPINQQFKSNGFLNFDQGLMWFEKGIQLLQKEVEKKLDIPLDKSFDSSKESDDDEKNENPAIN